MNFGYLFLLLLQRLLLLLLLVLGWENTMKKSPPGRETPCLWRTEKRQNCTPKMPNVTSETDRKWCFWLLFPLAAAMNFGYLLHPVPKWEHTWSSDMKTPWKKSPPGRETPCLWRTEKPQNCTPKMPNVTSETHRKWCFWLLFPLAAAMNFGYLYIRSPNRKTPWKKSPPGRKTPCLWRTEKPQNCTPKMPNVTSETHRKWWFWLLFPRCCYEFWLPFLPAAAEAFAAAAGPRMGKHHGKNHLPAGKHPASEGRRSPKIAPRKCLT